jgi:hypothetical protein
MQDALNGLFESLPNTDPIFVHPESRVLVEALLNGKVTSLDFIYDISADVLSSLVTDLVSSDKTKLFTQSVPGQDVESVQVFDHIAKELRSIPGGRCADLCLI